jgi:type II secretory pathway component HofQ
MRLTCNFLTWLTAVLVILQLHGRNQAAPAPDSKTESPVEKCHRLLEQNISVDLDRATLTQALEQFAARTRLRFHLDRAGLSFDEQEQAISHKQQDVKAKVVLRTILRPLSMTYIVLDDAVVVTSIELAAHRQLQQSIDLDLDQIPLANALQHLSRQTGANLVLDPRLGKEQRGTPVTLRLEEVALETAIKLIAEMANLGTARVGNVLFITTSERANKLRADPDRGFSLPALQYGPPGPLAAQPAGIPIPPPPVQAPPPPGAR